jgi:hypothetical protein
MPTFRAKSGLTRVMNPYFRPADHADLTNRTLTAKFSATVVCRTQNSRVFGCADLSLDPPMGRAG